MIITAPIANMAPFTGFQLLTFAIDLEPAFSEAIGSWRIARSDGTERRRPQEHVTSSPAWLVPIAIELPQSQVSK
jgi:hypothetical protein